MARLHWPNPEGRTGYRLDVGLGLVRAVVLGVEDAIVIVVEIGATVGVLEPVLVFGLARAGVPSIWNAVRVRVDHRGEGRGGPRLAGASL